MVYKLEIWRFGKMCESESFNCLNELKEYYLKNHKGSYDNGMCAFIIYRGKHIMTFEEEEQKGFHED